MKAPLRILVTRPLAQGQALCEKLQRAAFVTERVPVLSIETIDDTTAQQNIRHCFAQLDTYHALIVVSLNAAEQALPWLTTRSSNDKPLCIFCVGQSTADYLQTKFPQAAILYPRERMDSEGLLALPELQAVQGKRFLLVRGEGGREWIRENLQGRGAQVDTVELYRRRCPEENAAALQSALPETDVVLLNSVESLQNFVRLAGHVGLPPSCVALVPGARVAEAARTAGFTRIICAANATDDAVLAALYDAAPL